MRIINNIPAIQSYNALTATNNALAKSIYSLHHSILLKVFQQL